MINKVILVGNVGNDPEIRAMQNGDEVANFSLATSERWKDKNSGEKKEKTEWHRVVAWGNLATVVKNYVKKGSKLYIEGKLQTRKWTDQSGVEKYSTEIILQGFNATLQMLDSRAGDSSGVDAHNEAKANGYQPQTTEQAKQTAQSSVQELDDDIPF